MCKNQSRELFLDELYELLALNFGEPIKDFEVSVLPEVWALGEGWINKFIASLESSILTEDSLEEFSYRVNARDSKTTVVAQVITEGEPPHRNFIIFDIEYCGEALHIRYPPMRRD